MSETRFYVCVGNATFGAMIMQGEVRLGLVLSSLLYSYIPDFSHQQLTQTALYADHCGLRLVLLQSNCALRVLEYTGTSIHGENKICLNEDKTNCVNFYRIKLHRTIPRKLIVLGKQIQVRLKTSGFLYKFPSKLNQNFLYIFIVIRCRNVAFKKVLKLYLKIQILERQQNHPRMK